MLGAVAPVLVAGCSLVFDMGDYDRNVVADASPSSSSGSSGRAPDEELVDGGRSTDGGSGGAGGADGRGPSSCVRESEPNDDVSNADAFMPGETCGALSSVDDVDVYAFSTAASMEIRLTLPSDVKCEVFENGAASPNLTFTGSGARATVAPGTYVIRLSHVGAGGPPLEYGLAR